MNLLLDDSNRNRFKASHLTCLDFPRCTGKSKAHLVRCSTPREEVTVVIAMNRQIKDAGVVVESLLCPVSMVNILRLDRKHMMQTQSLETTNTVREADTDPVHDEDLVDVESLLQQFGCDGHRVEVAETPETQQRAADELPAPLSFSQCMLKKVRKEHEK